MALKYLKPIIHEYQTVNEYQNNSKSKQRVIHLLHHQHKHLQFIEGEYTVKPCPKFN